MQISVNISGKFWEKTLWLSQSFKSLNTIQVKFIVRATPPLKSKLSSLSWLGNLIAPTLSQFSLSRWVWLSFIQPTSEKAITVPPLYIQSGFSRKKYFLFIFLHQQFHSFHSPARSFILTRFPPIVSLSWSAFDYNRSILDDVAAWHLNRHFLGCSLPLYFCHQHICCCAGDLSLLWNILFYNICICFGEASGFIL